MSLGVGFKKVLAMDTAVPADEVIADGSDRLATVDDDGVTFTSHYLHHLFTAKEMLATIHNEWFTVRLVDGIRDSIDAGRFAELRCEWLGPYGSRR